MMLRMLGMGGKGGGGAAGGGAAAAAPLDLPNPVASPNSPAAAASSVFEVDEQLTELQRVKRYSLSQLPLQRLVYVKRLASCARAVGLKDALTHLLPLFSKLANDQEAVVRSAAAAELANIAHFLADPHQPYHSHPPPAVLPVATSAPPPTAQTPDLTLENDELLDITVDDVSNVLPAHLPVAASAAAAAAAAAVPAGGSDPSKPASAAGGSPSTTPANPDAMDMDMDAVPALSTTEAVSDEVAEAKAAEALQAAATSPLPLPASADSDADSSEPMDVSEVAAAEESGEAQPESPASLAVPGAQAPEAAQAAAAAVVAAATGTSTGSPASSPLTAPSPPSSPPLASLSPPPPAATTIGVVSPSPPPSVAAAAAAAPIPPNDPTYDPSSSLRVESYEQIKDTVIHALQFLIVDNNAEVRAAACDALVRVADVLRGDDVGKVVLTLVLNLAHDERDEQRTTAVHLMHELAPRLGHDLCRSFVALELAAFADDSTFRVRKATAQSFGNVCSMVGEPFTVSKLLPCYVRLSKDLIWGVRKGCVESLVSVSRAVSEGVRAEVLVPMFERFAKDSSRWVRNGAFEILGPFLHALGPNLASKPLVQMFAGIPAMSSAVVDAEVNYHAAFNLPAVLQTIGAARWDELAACFAQLTKATQFPVRRTLSYSLHELAQLLGPALTEQSLLPALDAFLRDLDEVRYGVLKNFALLLRCLTPAKRVSYLEVLWMVQKQAENWRWRLLWAKQLGAFAKLFDAEHTVTDIMPLAFALTRDNVAAVRRAAAAALPRVLLRVLSFPTPNPVLQQCLNDMHAFAASTTFMDRQLYLRVVEGAVGQLPAELLEQFLQRALPLCNDRTSNVRLAAAQMLRSVLGHPHVQQSPSAREMVQRLQNDSHAEVRRCIAEAQAAHAAAQITTSLGALNIAEGAAAAAAAAPAAATAAAAANSGELTDADLQDILAGPSDAAAAEPAVDSSAAADSAAAAAASSSAATAAGESSSAPSAASQAGEDASSASSAAAPSAGDSAEQAAAQSAGAAAATEDTATEDVAEDAAASDADAATDAAVAADNAAEDEAATADDADVASPHEIEAQVE